MAESSSKRKRTPTGVDLKSNSALLLEALVNNSPDVIMLVQRDGTIDYINRTRPGYIAEDVIGTNATEYLPQEFHQPYLEKISNLYEHGSDQAIDLVAEDHSHWMVRLTPIKTISDSVESAMVIATNVTEKKKLEHEFRQAQKMETVGLLAGSVAHDFNNILTTIMGYSDLALLRDDLPEHAVNAFENINSASRLARSLTQQLLTFSKKQITEKKIIDLDQQIKLFQSVILRLMGEQVEVELNLSASPYLISADPFQIQQALLNLAVNAKDAITEKGKLTISTFVEHTRDARSSGTKRSVVLKVEDTGCGMSEDVLERAVEPFFSTKPRHKGTGLGLSTVRNIIEQHDAEMLITSDPGKGSCFTIHFPLVEGVLSKEDLSRQPLSIDTSNKTILVVEDQRLVLRLVCELLKTLGYEIIAASKPVDAIDLAKRYSEKIDLLLTDVVMPDLNGKELYLKLLKIIPDLPVLYMSGYDEEVISERGILEDDHLLLQKPFTAEDLVEKLSNIWKQG